VFRAASGAGPGDALEVTFFAPAVFVDVRGSVGTSITTSEPREGYG
jgi:hypothetical protein